MLALDIQAAPQSADTAAEARPAPTVRRLLVRMLLMAQLPAIIAACALLVVDYQRQRREVADETAARVGVLHGIVRERVQGIQAALTELARQVPPNGRDMEAFSEAARRVAQETSVDSIVLLMPSGQQLLNTRLPPGAPLPRSPAEMLKPVQTGERTVNDLALSGEGRVPSVSIGVPVVRASHIAYGLDATLEADRLRQLLERQDLPAGWIGAVIDSRGVIIARIPNHEWFVGKPVTADLQAKVDAGGEGVFDSVTLDGVPVVTAYRKSPDLGWTTVVSVPRATLETPVRRSAAYLAGAFALLFALSMWAAMRLRWRIVRAIDKVRATALSLSTGGLVPMEPLGVAEADELADALLKSGRALQQANTALQRSQQRLEGILQTARSAIIVTDDAHRIVLFNAAAESTYGRRRADVLGHGVQMLFDDAGRQAYLQEVHSLAARTGNAPLPVKSATSTGVRADGSCFPIDFSISAVADTGSGHFHTLIVRDITEYMRNQESLVNAHLEVQRVTQGFHTALMREIDARQGQLARELHDAVGSSLAGTVLLLGSARSLAGDPRVSAMLQTAYRHVQETVERIRSIARGVMPAGTDAGLFLEALEQFVQDLGKPGSLTCSLNTRGDFSDLPPDVGTHLYRIVQEAAANAVRHGGARLVRIRVARAAGRCRLTIVDDGMGFDLERILERHAGLGLKSMQARARAIGADLQLRRRPAGGCSVRVTWPAQPAPQADARRTGGAT